jgi:hypothetical protein
MTSALRRRMTLLDATLLVGSAAIGLGLYELTHRALFKGWIWITDHRVPDFRTWSTMEAIVTLSDATVFLLPVVLPWTFLLLLLRMRSPRPPWRRIWRQPGMSACLAALFGCVWSGLILVVAMNLDRVARSRKTITADVWAQRYLSEEVFMYMGLAAAAVWVVQYLSGRWRRPFDWIDCLGRIVGACWIWIGLVWTLHEYIEFV